MNARCHEHPKNPAAWMVRIVHEGLPYVFKLCRRCGDRVRRETPNVQLRPIGIWSKGTT